jgi:hypothetical protein
MSSESSKPTLYERLGRVYSIAAVVDAFIDRVMHTVPGGSGQVTVPSAQNSGAGIPGQPGNKSGPAAKSSSATTGSGNNEGVREQDSAKIPGLPGSKSGPAVKPPSR